jgi:hypothetical protein
VIVSIHLAEVGWRRAPGMLRGQARPSDVPGLSYAEPVLSTPLRDGPIPRPGPGRVGLIAAWESDGALDSFLGSHPLAARFADGWHVRLEPLRVYGSWSRMPGLPTREKPVDDDEPVAVLTLGHTKLHRAVPFLRTSGLAEHAAVDDPAVLASTAFARPPRFVSTFSLWRSATAMRRYAHSSDGAHQAAVRADRAKPFHREAAFIRFRPYASQGSWGGRDPLATLIPPAPSASG